jgi:hypothetical protein
VLFIYFKFKYSEYLSTYQDLSIDRGINQVVVRQQKLRSFFIPPSSAAINDTFSLPAQKSLHSGGSQSFDRKPVKGPNERQNKNMPENRMLDAHLVLQSKSSLRLVSSVLLHG